MDLLEVKQSLEQLITTKEHTVKLGEFLEGELGEIHIEIPVIKTVEVPDPRRPPGLRQQQTVTNISFRILPTDTNYSTVLDIVKAIAAEQKSVEETEIAALETSVQTDLETVLTTPPPLKEI